MRSIVRNTTFRISTNGLLRFSTLVDTLSQKQHDTLTREKTYLDRIDNIVKATKFDNSIVDSNILQNAKRDLDEFFLMATIGEFNVGKSSFINTLLGKKILAEGVTPTTSKINFVRYGQTYDEKDGNVKNITIPVEWLRSCVIVDTPGLNSTYKDHQQITSDFIPRTDIVFFLTNATQIFNKSEIDFIKYIREWNKRAVIVISKKDHLESEEDLNQVISFLRTHFEKQFGYIPEIFPVSSKIAFQALNNNNPEDKEKLYKLSGFYDLEHYIKTVLNDKERIRVKFSNGLNIGSRLLEKYNVLCQSLVKELDTKILEVANLENLGKQYTTEMNRYVELNFNDIDRILWSMNTRACDLIDDTVQLTNFRILFSQKRFSEKFTKEVVDDINKTLEQKVKYMIDHFSTKNKEFLKRIRTDLINKFSEIKGLDYTSKLEKRKDLLDDSICKITTSHNKVENIDKIIDDIKNAFWSMIAVELAAIFGVGAVAQISALFAVPIEPIVFAATGTVIGALGIGILPYKRQKLKTMIKERTKQSSDELKKNLTLHFTNEINQNLSRIGAIIEPHHLLVKQDRDRFVDYINKLEVEFNETEQIKKVIDFI